MHRQTITNSELLSLCAMKDVSALKQLYIAHSVKLYYVAIQLLKQKELAQWVLEESFIKIWDSAKYFNPTKDNAIKWMMRITRYIAKEKVAQIEKDQS